jgi:hypothetical protein
MSRDKSGVLQGFDIARWRPGILIIERNRHFPDARIMRYLRDAGYVYRRTTGGTTGSTRPLPPRLDPSRTGAISWSAITAPVCDGMAGLTPNGVRPTGPRAVIRNLLAAWGSRPSTPHAGAVSQ